MKKKLCILSLVTTLFVVLLSGISIVNAYADTYEDEANLVFESTLEDFLEEHTVTAKNISITKEPVYDIYLNQLGYIYSMQYDNLEGFSFVINTSGYFQVTEFYFEAKNPYDEYRDQEYKKIYVSLANYLVYDNVNYTDAKTGNIVSQEIIEVLKGKAFSSDAAIIKSGTETFYYSNKSNNEYKMSQRHPAYYPVGADIKNACAPAAGANIIGFWTRYYPELVPGFAPGSMILGKYIYKEWASEANELVADLYYKMGTNAKAPGTTISEFRNGMNDYVTQHGRKITYLSCLSNGKFNYAFAKQQMESGTPLVLFIDGFRIDEIFNSENKVTLDYITADTAHAIAGFGYNEVTYSLTNGSIRNDYYIKVATGLGGTPMGYYNINYNTTIDECYAITIS